MTGDDGPGGQCFGDLPDDLHGAIYRHSSSPYDRARFAAVCKSWRTAASWQPKLPAMPLLLNSTGNGRLDRKLRAYSPEDGRVLLARLPLFPYGKCIVGSHDGGWVAAAFGCRVEIVNLFTNSPVMTTERLACRCSTPMATSGKISIEKVVFSEDPTSEGCILAATTTKCVIALDRLGCPGGGWTTRGCGADKSFVDITFCNGKLYGLSCSHKLYNLVIRKDEYNAKMLISFMDLTIDIPNMVEPKYIFELRGKLATAVMVSPRGSNKAHTFKVFELVSRSYKYAWAEVTSLGDHALFLGPGCCKAVNVSAVGTRGEVEEDRIYYTMEQCRIDNDENLKCLARLDLGSCIVYCYESEGVHHTEIMSRGYHYREEHDGISGRNSCTWILPPHF